MNFRNYNNVFLAVMLALGLALAPGTAFADTDDGHSVDDTEEAEVTMDDMMASEAEDEAATTADDDGNPSPHWTSIVALNALWGGIAGALVGGGLYLLTGMEWSPWVIAQFAGGGILVGATVGVIAAVAQTEPATQAMDHPSSVDWVTRDMPRTYRLNLMNFRF